MFDSGLFRYISGDSLNDTNLGPFDISSPYRWLGMFDVTLVRYTFAMAVGLAVGMASSIA